MKNKNFKLGMIAVCMLSASALSAQTTDATDTGLIKGAGAGESVRLIDNKGTIKYLQTNNGITSITSSTAGSATTTTLQLGGTLTSDTNIETGANEFKLTLDSGGTFVLNGVVQETGAHATTSGGTGWSLLSRDETSGEIKKLLLSDLVQGIRKVQVLTADATADLDITVSNLPALSALTSAAKLSVYRNGIKLRSESTDALGDGDYTVSAGKVTLTYDADDLPLFTGDVIEIQYVR